MGGLAWIVSNVSSWRTDYVEMATEGSQEESKSTAHSKSIIDNHHHIASRWT